jgi:hypothetical protein
VPSARVSEWKTGRALNRVAAGEWRPGSNNAAEQSASSSQNGVNYRVFHPDRPIFVRQNNALSG